ncbi:MAG: hypothetical protein IKU37_05870 [Candidatus Gastranaerophilales bacterium]|nr:hypothetical protein [Candidatus Gastranaerophilales bacterium]
MNIHNLNFYNIKSNGLNFDTQKLINFRANQKYDSVEFSPEANAERMIAKLESDISDLTKRKEEAEARKVEIENDIVALEKMLGKISFSVEEFECISEFSRKKMYSKDLLVMKLQEILSAKSEEYSLSTKTLELFSSEIKREPRLRATSFGLIEEKMSAIKNIIKKLVTNLNDENECLNKRITECESLIKTPQKQIEHIIHFPNFAILYDSANCAAVSQKPKIELARELGCIIDLESEQYANLSPYAKEALKSQLEKFPVGREKLLINSKENQEYLTRFENFEVISTEELETFFGLMDIGVIFPNAESIIIGSKKLVLFPKDNSYTQAIADLKSGKVKTKAMLSKERNIDAEHLPFVYKKYDKEDKDAKINFMFINPDNELNSLIISQGSKFRQYLSRVSLEHDKKPWGEVIDVENPKNQQLLSDIHPLYPRKSSFAYKELHAKTSEIIDIPVTHLEKLGFAKKAILIDLINKGELDGEVNEDGESFVTISTEKHIGKNKNLNKLQALRDGNPHIKTFAQVSKALRIKGERLEYAIFCGDVEIIEEYINVADRERRYIDIATPKNQEFIRKVKFEQELKKSLRETHRQARIEQKDLTPRIQALRMALVWEFMPNTRAIGSMLAKGDGHVSKLLAKEDDPNENLTPLEKAKIYSYRRDVWMSAGTDELHEAHKKASAIIKTFNEQGLSAVDEQYLPIFERYGFVLA